MSNQRKAERRKEIARLIQEGRAAFEAGVHRQNVPREYLHTMNSYHWRIGYEQAYLDAREREAVTPEARLIQGLKDAIEALESGSSAAPVVEALKALLQERQSG